GGDDKIKKWIGALEGATLDDCLDDVPIDETSPVRRQPKRPTVIKIPHAIGPERFLHIVKTTFGGIKHRGVISLPCQIYCEGVLHLRRDVVMRVETLVPEDPRVDTGDHLEFRDPAPP